MSILRSGIIVTSCTLLSRITGLLRELVLAYFFGASKEADCINVALKLPNLFRRILAEGALTSVFIPMYSHKLQTDAAQGKAFAGQIFWLLLLLLTAITIIMQIFMPQIMMLLAPGFLQEPSKFAIAVLLCRLTMPYLIFICSCALMGAVMNAHGNFIAFASAPIILNIVIILAGFIEHALIAKPIIIALAVLFGGALQLWWMHINLRHKSLSFPINRKGDFSSSITLIKQMIPASLSSGMMQISLFISQSIASFCEGAIAILSYAERIYQFPLSLIGTAFATILLPELSKMYATGDKKGAARLQENALKFAFYISLPCAVGIAALSDFIIYSIYCRGAFTLLETAQTAYCLTGFAFGLPAFILNKVFTPVFYANNDQQTPLKITIYSLILNIALNLILIQTSGAAGIAFGSSVAAWFNALLLFIKIRHYGCFNSNIRIFVSKVIICNVAMLLGLLLIKQLIDAIYLQHGNLVKLGLLLLLIVIGAAIYFLTSWLSGIISQENWQFAKKKLRR
jgi:putative peptidoglycan lipid II flippase